MSGPRTGFLRLAGFLLALGTAAAADAPPDTPAHLPATVVTATRAPESPERVAATSDVLGTDALRAAPTATLDSALRSVPSFSLFRRSDSLTANPTTQGVSLRGLGPSGASRSLVLLDGVPLNDPFGGWVNWSQIPRDAVSRVEIVPGGGATAWGDAALGGVLQVFLQAPRTDATPSGPRGTAQVSALAGDHGTRSGSVLLNQPAGSNGILQVMAEDFITAGFNTVAPERRGPIDVNAWSRHRSVLARWNEALGSKAEVSLSVRSFDETRGNGTPYQRNGTRSRFAAFQVAGDPTAGFAWNSTAYVQQQSYASTFSVVNAQRTAETPASDQFAVPATAIGFSWTGTVTRSPDATTSFGVDARSVHGETRENYSFSSGDYTRQRTAGGTQTFAGAFALHQQQITPTLRTTLGLRIDEWTDENGHRRELLRSTGALTRDDHYLDRHGNELSPNLGAIWIPARAWRIRANAQQAFRRPTLNELYRPFRQGANVTEANAALRTERVNAAEVGAEWRLWPTLATAPARLPSLASPPKPSPLLTLGATAFWNDLHDAVTNVTVARGPGTFPLFGTLPAGSIGRERLNLDRVRVQGAEFSATWTPADPLSVTAAFLYDDARVRRAVVAPGLVGNRLPGVPRQSASVAVTYRLAGNIRLTPRLRWMGRQFDDDENTLKLGEAVVVDLGVSRPLTRAIELFLTLENAGNARVETARSADGVVNLGPPRLFLGGLRGTW